MPDDRPRTAADSRLLHFEDCRSAIDQLFADAVASRGEVALQQFLEFAARFTNLSIYNTMLVQIQRPGATAVGSRRDWEKKGRTVAPDAIPVVVLQPFGPVRFLYELGDTAGEPLPGAEQLSIFADGAVSQRRYDELCSAATAQGVAIMTSDQYGFALAGTAAGIKMTPQALAMSPDGPWFRVKVNARHDLPTRFATAAHELGHVYCGHVGGDPRGRWPARRGLGTATAELEAESVAWLVCQRNGVTSRSADYMRSLMPDANIGQFSMYTVFEAANRVESRTTRRQR